jgi:hypothetical protein
MKKMTLKGKIATGVVAASIIGSSTFAFASTNAGEQFRIWGQAQIDAAKTAVDTAQDSALSTNQTTIGNEAAADRDASEGRINQAGANEVTDTETKIKGKLAEHVASLQAQLATFLAAIGGDFDALVNAENDETTGALDTQYTALETNISNVLTAAKNRNVEEVTEASLLVKGKATSDLIIEINRVKKALADEVASQKATATTEVMDHLESEVNRINGQLDTLISGLESAATTAIAAAGQSVEDSAIANFERVISQTGVQTPIVVDPQKLDWKFENARDGKMKFEVTNRNAFDVVFEYEFVTPGKPNNTGVSETPYASLAPGKNTMYFDVNKLLGFDRSAILVIRYLDENGDFKYTTEIQLGDLIDFPNE